MRQLQRLAARVFIALTLATAAQAQGLNDVHTGMGLPCTACHIGEATPAKAPPSAVCTSCHGTMIEPLAAGEDVSLPDPHRSPHLRPDQVPDCTACHSEHAQSKPTCTRCHRRFQFDMNDFTD